MFDKLSEKYYFTVSGEISDIIRGDKRRLEEIRILPDKDNIYRKFKKFSVGDVESLDREKIIDHLCDSGVWPNIIQRPFGHVADTHVSPKAIHISFFDTSPLSPDYSSLYLDQIKYIEFGLKILSKLTRW